MTPRQRAILEKWTCNKAGTPYRVVERAQFILMSADGVSNVEQGRRLGVDRQRARRWRTRWAKIEERLADAEKEGKGWKLCTAKQYAMAFPFKVGGAPPQQFNLAVVAACLRDKGGKTPNLETLCNCQESCDEEKNDASLATTCGPPPYTPLQT